MQLDLLWGALALKRVPGSPLTLWKARQRTSRGLLDASAGRPVWGACELLECPRVCSIAPRVVGLPGGEPGAKTTCARLPGKFEVTEMAAGDAQKLRPRDAQGLRLRDDGHHDFGLALGRNPPTLCNLKLCSTIAANMHVIRRRAAEAALEHSSVERTLLSPAPTFGRKPRCCTRTGLAGTILKVTLRRAALFTRSPRLLQVYPIASLQCVRRDAQTRD